MRRGDRRARRRHPGVEGRRWCDTPLLIPTIAGYGLVDTASRLVSSPGRQDGECRALVFEDIFQRPGPPRRHQQEVHR
jgi:hypothetical protein